MTNLIAPPDLNTYLAKPGSGQGSTIRFQWEPIKPYGGLDPKLGYHVIVTAPHNGAELYVSHDGFLDQGKLLILSQQAMYGLTGGEDTAAQWNITVVMASGGFDDSTHEALGTVINCGPSSPTRTVYLHV